MSLAEERVERRSSHSIYKKELLPPDSKEVILDVEYKHQLEGRSVLEVVEEKIKKSQIKLLKLQKKIKEATEKSRALEEDVLFEAKKEAEKIIRQSHKEAENIIQQAQQKADEILANAKIEIENAKIEVENAKTEIEKITKSAKQQGYEEGFNEGKKEGITAGEEVIKNALAEIQHILIEAKHKREEIIQTNQETIIELALMIAKKIIKTEIAINKEVIFKNLNQALEKLKEKEKIKVKVNPIHLQELKDRKEELLAQVSNIEGVEFEEDKNIEPGGCVIETNFGLIDATISSQLEIIEEVLRRR